MDLLVCLFAQFSFLRTNPSIPLNNPAKAPLDIKQHDNTPLQGDTKVIITAPPCFTDFPPQMTLYTALFFPHCALLLSSLTHFRSFQLFSAGSLPTDFTFDRALCSRYQPSPPTLSFFPHVAVETSPSSSPPPARQSQHSPRKPFLQAFRHSSLSPIRNKNQNSLHADISPFPLHCHPGSHTLLRQFVRGLCHCFRVTLRSFLWCFSLPHTPLPASPDPVDVSHPFQDHKIYHLSSPCSNI